MSELAAARIKTVRDHMALEVTHDWDGVIATFAHPRYEMYGGGQVFDGEAAVREHGEADGGGPEALVREAEQRLGPAGVRQRPRRRADGPAAVVAGAPQLVPVQERQEQDRGPEQEQRRGGGARHHTLESHGLMIARGAVAATRIVEAKGIRRPAAPGAAPPGSARAEAPGDAPAALAAPEHRDELPAGPSAAA